ncbi:MULTISPECIES: hypothetical protein [Shewanella]|uniref:hypothetical protein n=1 Tax=Shewanella TaxID=22 RepID=UPI0006DA9A36|nr:hypothetical protein [Shewanella sp. Sh95]KPN75978.1 hypothetical protein AEA42_16315 [Shewanella sp. Sh95]
MNFSTLIVTIVIVLFAQSAHAASEWVYLYKAMDDNAIVVRKNGDAYQIEKGVGCLSIWRFEGKAVLISSPGLFLGVGSELILPDADQKCRIWDSSSLGSIEGLTAPSQSQSPQQSSGCEDGHWIQSIAGNGEIIKLEDGSIWQVDAVDTVTSSIWLPVSNVTICGSYLINTDDGEKVSATRLK